MRCSTAKNFISGRGVGLRSLVAQYVSEHRPRALQEKDFFQNMPSLEPAIHHAAFALDDRAPPKRYSHQCRIRLALMRKAHEVLLQSKEELHAMANFDDLHRLLGNAFSRISGLGALYTYDTALRLGFFLRLEPASVYLHAGTRRGARALGIRASHVVRVRDLPQELRVLPPHEIENFLCIFKPKTEG